jgi:uncharacterized membrane protein
MSANENARSTGNSPAEPALLDVLLTPHRSLSPRGFVVLMTAVCAVSFAAGLAFYIMGAWPVVGFFGLDVLLIYLAFRINYRHGRIYETLRLTRRALTVERGDHWGKVSRWRLQPAWIQVLVDDSLRHESRLTLRSHGRSVTIGTFLTAEERLDLAKALRGALTKLHCLPEPV